MSHNLRGHHSRSRSAGARKVDPKPREMVQVRQGINRQAGRKPHPPRPLSARHEAVLALLGELGRGPTELGRELGLKPSAVQSALYVLQSRGLAFRRPDGSGWLRVR